MSERLALVHKNLMLLSTLGIAACVNASEKAPPLPAGATEVNVSVDDQGYHPAELRAPAGRAVRLIFTRTSDAGCGQQVVFPDQKLTKDLPLKEAVPVDITMPTSGKVTFTCGMDMYRGAVVVE